MEQAAHPKSDDIFDGALPVEFDTLKKYVAFCIRIGAEKMRRKFSVDLLFDFGPHKSLVEVKQPFRQIARFYQYPFTSEIGILT